MPDSSRKGWAGYVVLGLSVFLCFCLLFESFIEVPALLTWLGHWHPMLLHFPIVLLLLLVFLGLTNQRIPDTLFEFAVISALLTAITGFFLAAEISGKGTILTWHQYLGSGTALLAALWYGLRKVKRTRKYLFPLLQLMLLGLIVSAGHFGGMITHGEDFLDLPVSAKDRKLPDNPLIYEDVVYQILDDHCIKCHNSNKRKGELLLTSLNDMFKGGESGTTMVAGSPETSELIRRLHLPQSDEEHMPPDGEKPLEKKDIQIIERWIALGASDSLRMNDLSIDEPLFGIIREMTEPDREAQWAELPQIPDSTLVRLSNDYITIRRISQNTGGLSIKAYLPPSYDPKALLALNQIASNIVELDLSGLPIGAAELELAASCPHLERLELDKTPISDDDLRLIKDLQHLTVLKLYETKVGDSSVQTLLNLKGLTHVYLHDTNFSREALDNLKAQKKELSVFGGPGEEKQDTDSPDAE